MTGEPREPFLHRIRQARRAPDVEAQFDGGRHLVVVLPTRPGGADEGLDEFIVKKRDRSG